jgi:hypothetical protein
MEGHQNINTHHYLLFHVIFCILTLYQIIPIIFAYFYIQCLLNLWTCFSFSLFNIVFVCLFVSVILTLYTPGWTWTWDPHASASQCWDYRFETPCLAQLCFLCAKLSFWNYCFSLLKYTFSLSFSKGLLVGNALCFVYQTLLFVYSHFLMIISQT